MKNKTALLFALVFILSLAFMLTRPGMAQKGGQQSHNRPRANQGRVPPAPPARSHPTAQRQAERLPTGHVNDTPHVNHNQWYGHEQPNDARFHLDHPFPNGRFAHAGPTFRYEITRVDANLHRFWLPGGFCFELALWDWPLFADWCWDCGDDFVIYDDPDHIGWCLLYNVHTGIYVHVQYMGM
ncbi:MAG: hypothetical protein ABR951_08405 [Candidatus Aminicenantales bacterium]|jgi:hypothetical protein